MNTFDEMFREMETELEEFASQAQQIDWDDLIAAAHEMGDSDLAFAFGLLAGVERSAYRERVPARPPSENARGAALRRARAPLARPRPFGWRESLRQETADVVCTEDFRPAPRRKRERRRYARATGDAPARHETAERGIGHNLLSLVRGLFLAIKKAEIRPEEQGGHQSLGGLSFEKDPRHRIDPCICFSCNDEFGFCSRSAYKGLDC